MGGAAASLTAEEKERILGGESTMWSEYVGPENIDSRIWPRNAAIAERFWSPQETVDVASMYQRMEAESKRLEWLGLTHRSYQRKMVQRMAGTAAPSELASLGTLTEALEPVKDYTREENAATEPTSQTPLNRVVDAVQPESEASRRFSVGVDQFVASSCKDALKASELRAELTLWAGNDARLQLLAERSFLVQEARPASSALSQAAELALNALDRLTQGLPLTEDLKKQQIEALQALELQAHKSQLTLPARAAFQRLIEAAASGSACANSR
jgi:hexosaminidase